MLNMKKSKISYRLNLFIIHFRHRRFNFGSSEEELDKVEEEGDDEENRKVDVSYD